MAIFQKAYQGYAGELTAPLQRTLVIFRYALADVFQSRIFTAFFLLCFLPSLLLLCVIYTYYNLELLMQFEVPIEDFIAIDGTFFALFMQYPQMFLLFVMIMSIGPTMISPDLRNNAMPLYLSRPINKASYIFGKLLVLLFLGSLISWIPSLILIFLQAYLAGDGWLINNLHLLAATVVTSLSWIVSLSLLAFAISASVKWKAVARLFFFAFYLFGSILGEVIKAVFGGWGGGLVDISSAAEVLVLAMYDADASYMESSMEMPIWAAAFMFLAVSVLAALVLTRRIRAFQVVS